MLFENIPPLPQLQLPLFYGAYNQEAKSCGLLGSYHITYDAQKSAQKDGWNHRIQGNQSFDSHTAMQHIEELKQRAFASPKALALFCKSGVPLHLPDSNDNNVYGYITSTGNTTMFCRLMPDNYTGSSIEIQCYDTGTLRQHLDYLEAAQQQSQTVRFYYPAFAEYFPLLDTEFGFNERTEHPAALDGYELADFQKEICQRIRKETMLEEAVRGLFAFYGDDDSLWRKMVSAEPAVEVIGGKLWGVGECQVFGELTEAETTSFKDWWQGQMSDGWGEGFEQRGIPSGQNHIGELYVHFWDCRDWDILTEEEFNTTQQHGQQMA